MSRGGVLRAMRMVWRATHPRKGTAVTPLAQQAGVVQPQTTRDCWGDPISDERKAELDARMQAWETLTDRRGRIGPFEEVNANADDGWLGASGFRRVRLSGADVFWLTMRAYVGLTYRDTDMTRGAKFREADEVFHDPHMRELIQGNAHDLDLRGADLGGAHLQNAYLPGADMRHVNLAQAHLEGADLSSAQLEDADLQGAVFDKGTTLDGTRLNRVRLRDVAFGDADITVVKWEEVDKLGDEVRSAQIVERYKRQGGRVIVVWENTYLSRCW